MFEYYAMGKESEKIHDIHKYLLNICNKKMVDKLAKRQTLQQRIDTSEEKKPRTSFNYRPREKYPTLIGAQYKFFKAQPNRKQIYLSNLQNDCSLSTPRLQANSIVQEHKIENQTCSVKFIKTATNETQRNISSSKSSKPNKTYFLPKCDGNWILHLKQIRKRLETIE